MKPVKTFSGGKPNYVIPPETQSPAQVSPAEFIHIVQEKEDLTGTPIIWAQWPNEELKSLTPKDCTVKLPIMPMTGWTRIKERIKNSLTEFTKAIG